MDLLVRKCCARRLKAAGDFSRAVLFQKEEMKVFMWRLVSPDRAECFSAVTLTHSSFTLLQSSNLEQNSPAIKVPLWVQLL